VPRGLGWVNKFGAMVEAIKAEYMLVYAFRRTFTERNVDGVWCRVRRTDQMAGVVWTYKAHSRQQD